MTTGPGKYDDVCTVAREMTDADFVLLVIMGGNKGQGFSVQCIHPEMVKRVPELMRSMADDIEKDMG